MTSSVTAQTTKRMEFVAPTIKLMILVDATNSIVLDSEQLDY